jgi:O-antigen ligase
MISWPQTVPNQFRKSRWLTFAFFLVAIIVAYKAAGYIIANDLASLLYIALMFIILVFVLALLQNWRNGVYLFLAWLLFEDFARKFLGNNMAIYFAKDFLVLLVYLSFFAAYRRKDPDVQTFRPPFLPILLLLLWYAAIQVFNPGSTSIFFGLLGIKIYFYYVPLMFVGYSMVNSETELRKCFYINLGLMLIIAMLGIVQSVAGPRFLNPEVMADDIRLLSETYRVSASGARAYRPTSVFVSAGRFGDLLIVAWFLVFGFSGYLLLRVRRGRLLAFSALAITAAACLMTTSRGVFMWSLGSSIVGGIAFVWGAPWRQGEALRVFRTLQRAALGIALAVVMMFFVYPEAFLNRLAIYSETLDPRSPTSELVHRSRDYPLKNFLAAFDYDRWPYGYGIGTISLGGQYVSRFFHVRPPVGGVESGFGALIVEMGILGLILWIAVSVAIVISAWKVVRGLKGSPWFPLAFMILLYAFVLLLPMTFVSMNGYEDFIFNAYLWLLLGILFRLPSLALSAQSSADIAAVPTARRWVR